MSNGALLLSECDQCHTVLSIGTWFLIFSISDDDDDDIWSVTFLFFSPEDWAANVCPVLQMCIYYLF